MHCSMCGAPRPVACYCYSLKKEPVGTILKEIIPSVFESKGCACKKTAEWMDRIGVEGCIAHREKIVDKLMRHARKKKVLSLVPDSLKRSVANMWLSKAIERASNEMQ